MDVYWLTFIGQSSFSPCLIDSIPYTYRPLLSLGTLHSSAPYIPSQSRVVWIWLYPFKDTIMFSKHISPAFTKCSCRLRILYSHLSHSGSHRPSLTYPNVFILNCHSLIFNCNEDIERNMQRPLLSVQRRRYETIRDESANVFLQEGAFISRTRSSNSASSFMVCLGCFRIPFNSWRTLLASRTDWAGMFAEILLYFKWSISIIISFETG